MPPVTVAPSPSPIVAPPASANAATTDAGAPDGAAADIPTQPFAALLRHQVSQHASAKSPADKKSVTEAFADAQAAKQPDTGEQAPVDAISVIAQMLSGIAPPTPGQAPVEPQEDLPTADAHGKKSAADETAQDPLVLALATTASTPAHAVAPPPVSEAETPKPLSPQPLLTGAAENFAAEGLQNAASHAASTKEEGADFAALLAAQQEARPATAATTHAASAAASDANVAVHVETPVGTRGWDNEVGDKLTWLVNKHETRADLVLNPPELGRIEVSISLKGDQASASFVSASPTVREAIENAVPRLREILQDAGISLGQAQVGAESFQQPAGNREKGDNSSRRASDETIAPIQNAGASGTTAIPTLRRGNGLVDTFA